MRRASECDSQSGRPTRPLFNIDPGWLFIIAGLAMCITGVLIPAQRDLLELRVQLDALRQREAIGTERLRAHAEFLADLERRDAGLTRRLAASQLNVVPAGDVPVILAASSHAALTEWIDERAIHRAMRAAEPVRKMDEWPDSRLTRIATGPHRLWLLGGGVMAVFMGLMLTSSRMRDREHAAGWVERRKERNPPLALQREEDCEIINDPHDAEADDEDDGDDEEALADDPKDEEIIMLQDLAETADSVEAGFGREDSGCEIVIAKRGVDDGESAALADPRCAAD